MADEDLVEIRRRHARIRQGSAGRLDDQALDILVLMAPEGRMTPADDARHHFRPPEKRIESYLKASRPPVPGTPRSAPPRRLGRRSARPRASRSAHAG